MNAESASERSDSSSLLSGERNVLELMATGAGLHDVLDALCRVIDDNSGLMSSVYVLNRAGSHLMLAAAPHVPDGWRAATQSFAATATESSCGAAVTARTQVVVADVATSPLFSRWRDEAARSHIASIWSTPLFSRHANVLGTFAMLSHERRGPTDDQRFLVERAKRLASIAIERHQYEESLRESERRFSTAFYSSPGCLSITRASDARFMYINDRFETLFGYSRSEVVGHTAIELGLYGDPVQRTRLLQLLGEHKAHAVEVKARTKAGSTLDVLAWMERIPLLGEETILTVACDITDRRQAEEKLAQNEQLLRVVLDTLPVGVAVVDVAGDVIVNNPSSTRIWGNVIASGPERYARSKGWWHDTKTEIAPGEWGSVRAIATGESQSGVIEIEAFDGVRKIIKNSAVPIRDASARITGAVIVNEDLTARVKAEQQLQASLTEMHALTAKLMRAQDDERRRIAQMLHETTAQDLAALKMHLARLTRTEAGLTEDDRAALAESIELAERSMMAVRTLSYLLHPPFLDESGLLSAVRWYVTGFSDRSGIKVDVDLPTGFERLPQDVETALFRVLQEALINIHYHAHSPSAAIRLRVDGRELTLDVEDRGRGMPSAVLAQLLTGGGAPGVGIAGMRERLKQLDGTLEIESNDRGTLVRARIPLPGAPS